MNACVFALTPASVIFESARDPEPLHAEASGHPEVGSSDSKLNERLADTSTPAWKVTSSKRGKGCLDDLPEGSDDKCRNDHADDLDFLAAKGVRRGVISCSEAPGSPRHRCIACSQALATNF